MTVHHYWTIFFDDDSLLAVRVSEAFVGGGRIGKRKLATIILALGCQAILRRAGKGIDTLVQ